MSIVETDPDTSSSQDSDDENFAIPYTVSQTGDEKLKKLERMREEVDWNNIKERRSFFDQFRQLSVGWERHLPDLREFFSQEQVDWMLMQCAPGLNLKNAVTFVSFVVRTGYKDEPPLDERGMPLVRRNTPVHYAITHGKDDEELIRELFKIYDSFYVNYVSDIGITHFHMACLMGYYDVVQEFLTYHQNPNSKMTLNLLGKKIKYTPLYFATMIKGGGKEVMKLLLEYGANPYLTSEGGKSPLHVICNENFSDENRVKMLEILLEKWDLKHFPENKRGTPLKLALLKRWPNMIDRLVDHGALSNFVFPSEEEFKKSVTNIKKLNVWDRLEIASSTLANVERLEKKGYNLDQSDATTVMKFLIDRLGFKSNAEREHNYESWRYNARFVTVSRKIKIRDDEPSLKLYNLTRSPPSEPRNPLTYEDYLMLSRSLRLRSKLLSSKISEACAAYLFEKMSAGFFRQWTLGPFMMKTGQRYSKLDCMNVFRALKCQDLLQRYGV
uniref:Uncharacterized protein n=1 Tax=Trichogramma kaykai TaxID=54128 RepID=A0ABD2WR03_9HYME